MTKPDIEIKTYFGESAAEQVKYSVIIPIFGDPFFITTIFYLQRALSYSFEIVVVCDDPRITMRVTSALESRRKSFRLPMTLVCPSRNLGYGRATNLGASLALGGVLFLMNSDVFVADEAPLREACDLIARQASAGRDTIVGFSLLFEDRTIQHMGIDFVRAHSLDGLFIARHPLKGTPIDWYNGPSIRRVQATTGALLGISRELFALLGGFDPLFRRGDFEDADLCLRAAAMGAEICVLVRPGLYHFERQSFRLIPAGERSATTLANCRAFNQRWVHQLGSKVRVIRGAAGGRERMS